MTILRIFLWSWSISFWRSKNTMWNKCRIFSFLFIIINVFRKLGSVRVLILDFMSEVFTVVRVGIVLEGKVTLLFLKPTIKPLLSKLSIKRNLFSFRNLLKHIFSTWKIREKMVLKVFWLKYMEFMRFTTKDKSTNVWWCRIYFSAWMKFTKFTTSRVHK